MISAIVVLIHGAWLHASTWAPWCERIEARGHTCMAPAWPHLDGEPDAIRDDPPPALEVLYLQDIVDHYAATRNWEEREFRKHISDWELDRYFEII